MFKIDKVKSSFDCDLCNKLLVDPVVMPCGNSICKAHLNEVLTNISAEKNTFICFICQEEHYIPKNGFTIHKKLQNLLSLELNALEPSPLYEECKKKIENAKEKVVKIELLEKNPENYLYEYFEDIKRQVDLRREELKLKIDNYSDDIIRSIDDTHMDLIKVSKEVNSMSLNIEKSKEELNKLIEKFDTLKFSDEKFDDIDYKMEILNKEMKKIINQYQDLLLENQKYIFEYEELPVENIFGRFFKFEVSYEILFNNLIHTNLKKF